MKKLLVFFSVVFSSGLYAGNGTWNSIGDIPSFPDGQPQVTRGPGALNLIVGNTSPSSDPRNAFCIKITDPANFVATTDNAINNAANTDFDTRLYLFDKKGQPILFNDDTPPSTFPFPSTLTGVATDGSGYELMQGGEYILVVAGFPDDPMDNIANTLFNQDAELVHAPIPDSNKFATWENNNPATGGYFLALEGVSYCQDQLDIVGTGNINNNTKLCSGDGSGGFSGCNNESNDSIKLHLATGYLDDDAHLDVVFDDYQDNGPSICLGNGMGGYRFCYAYNIGTNITDIPLIGDINNDGHMDVVFLANYGAHKACIGDGSGFFTSCTDIPSTRVVTDGHLALMDGDNKLDLIFINPNGIHVCLGDGMGGFDTCALTTTDVSTFEVADVNLDGINDLITVKDNGTNKVCINQGSGILTCSDINPNTDRSKDLAVKDLNNDGYVDVVISNVTGGSPGINEVCLGNGVSSFTCSAVSGVEGNYSSVRLGMLNDDNYYDAVFSAVEYSRICMGNGDGTFSNCYNDSGLNFFHIEMGEFGTFGGDDIIFVNGFE